MIKKTSGKKELVKTIQKLLKEARSTRADFDRGEIESSLDDLSDLDAEFPGERSPSDDLEADIHSDDQEENHRFWLSRFEDDEDDYLRGDEDFHMYDNEQRIEDEDDFDRFSAESDRDERLGGMHKLGEESLMEMAIIKRIILNRLIKENYYNLMGTPSANPVASNGNGVEATLTKKKKLEEQSGIPDLLRNSGTEIQNFLASKAGYPAWKPGMENDEKVQDIYSQFMQSESKKLKEDRIDPITGKGAGGVQSQMILKQKKAAEEKATKEGK